MPMQQKKKKRKRKEIRPRNCRFCDDAIKYIDFKDAETLLKYQTEKGRILPRRLTGICLNHQKELGEAIKRARIISLVP